MDLVSRPQRFAFQVEVQNLLSDSGQLLLLGLEIGIPMAPGQLNPGLVLLELFYAVV